MNTKRDLFHALRATARMVGYTLALYEFPTGDCEVLVIPWEERPCLQTELLDELIKTLDPFYDTYLISLDDSDTQVHPHGRRTWTIGLGGGPLLTVSVMPPNTDKGRHHAKSASAREQRRARGPRLDSTLPDTATGAIALDAARSVGRGRSERPPR